MSSTNKTSLGLNMWEASDKPVRQDFVNDNVIIDDKISKLNSNLASTNSNLATTNSNLANKANSSDLAATNTAVSQRLVNSKPSRITGIDLSTEAAVLLKIDGNTYIVPRSDGNNRYILSMGVVYDSTLAENVLQVTWYADGSTRTNKLRFS
ncbi:hypothetical protein AALB39_28330 [Lachnospiraceae bacterium 54-53]